jgi:hypothetical protein
MAYTPAASLTATPRSNPVGVATDSAGFYAQPPVVYAAAVTHKSVSYPQVSYTALEAMIGPPPPSEPDGRISRIRLSSR